MTTTSTTTPAAVEPAIPASLKGKKILLVNHSDTLGGASVVTYRLMQALIHAGLDVKMLVYTKTLRDDRITPIATRFQRGVRFMLERARIFWLNGFSYANVFKVSTGEFAYGIASHPWAREADIIALNWINQGLMNVDGLLKLHKAGKHIVWTMHDMWPMTGICHHAYDCRRYEKECGNCPQLGVAAWRNDISHRVWKKKMKVYSQVPVKFVAVSHWAEECARQSSLLRNADVRTIHNAFPTDDFFIETRRVVPQFEPFRGKKIILFGAARLDDPIKGIDIAIDALNTIFDNYPEVADNCVAIFFGAIRDRSILDRLRMNHYHTGMLNDSRLIRHLCAMSKVILSTSHYETLSGTLIEGMAGGAIPVTFGRGGQADIVNHLSTGYIAEYPDVSSVVKGLLWALDADISREHLHETIKTRFAAEKIASQYISLFEEFYR